MSSSESRIFAPITDAVLARARQDPGFRQQLLTHNLSLLLDKLQSLRSSRKAGASPAQMREGALLAVRLAELIQAAGGSPPGV